MQELGGGGCKGMKGNVEFRYMVTAKQDCDKVDTWIKGDKKKAVERLNEGGVSEKGRGKKNSCGNR